MTPKKLNAQETEVLAALLRRAIANTQLNLNVASPYAKGEDWKKDGWTFNDRHDGNGIEGNNWNLETSDEAIGKILKPKLTIFVPHDGCCFLAGASSGSANICVISKLWTDSLENHYSAALGYETVGYTPDKAEAEAMVAAAGNVEGSGWPISKGETMPRLNMCEISRIFAET